MTYILYPTVRSDGLPGRYNGLCKIYDDSRIDKELEDMGLRPSEVALISDQQFSEAELFFQDAFKFTENNTARFDLEIARAQVAKQVRGSKRFLDAIPGKFSQEVLSAQASLPIAERLPGVQAYFDAVNSKLSELTDALAIISETKSPEVLKSYIDN